MSINFFPFQPRIVTFPDTHVLPLFQVLYPFSVHNTSHSMFLLFPPPPWEVLQSDPHFKSGEEMAYFENKYYLWGTCFRWGFGEKCQGKLWKTASNKGKGSCFCQPSEWRKIWGSRYTRTGSFTQWSPSQVSGSHSFSKRPSFQNRRPVKARYSVA